jgi:hypothetical protein
MRLRRGARPVYLAALSSQAKMASKTIAQNGCGPVDPKGEGTKIVPKRA